MLRAKKSKAQAASFDTENFAQSYSMLPSAGVELGRAGIAPIVIDRDLPTIQNAPRLASRWTRTQTGPVASIGCHRLLGRCSDLMREHRVCGE